MGPGPWAQFLNPTFRVNVAEPQRLSTKTSFPELIRGFPRFPDSPEMVQTGPVQPWVLHVPGAKMTVAYTNSTI